MAEEDKWDFINQLDEELLQGGVILSEWSAFLIRDADTAYCAGANLAAILAAQAAIESHLRYEYAENTKKRGFFQLIEASPISEDLKADLHLIRKYRNQWVHVNEPHQDDDLLKQPNYVEKELEEMAKFSIRVMRKAVYLEQFV
jgi:hypothetical protein